MTHHKIITSHIRTTREELVSDNGVVAAGHEIVARAGVEIMRSGGNAIDAGVAAAFVAQLAEPGMCGIGGNGTILVHRADSGQVTLFDDTTVAPARATPDQFQVLPGTGGFYGWDNVKDDENILGHKSVAIPGTVAGLCAALEQHGTMSLPDILAPAIELAEEGVPVDERTTILVAKHLRWFKQFPLLGKLFLNDGLVPTPGNFWTPGDNLTWPELAKTYRAIAAGGPRAFYEGPIAMAIADDMSKNGGILTYEDLANYKSGIRDINDDDLAEYRGLKYMPGDATLLVQVLNILENFNIRKMGADNHNYRHLMLEVMRRAYINYFSYPREPGLLSKPYAAEIADSIRLDRKTKPEKTEPWSYQDYRPESYSPGPVSTSSPGNTTTLTAADRDGNVLNILTSLGNAFGSYVVVPGTGIILNDHMCNFDPVPGRPLSLGLSRRPPPGSHVPMFFKDGKPFLAMDAPGARRSMSAVIHVIVHCIDFGLGIQEAMEIPRVWAEAIYPQSFVDNRVSPSIKSQLTSMGHDVVSMEPATSGGFGRPAGVIIADDGRLHAGADPLYGTGVAGF